MGFGYYIPILGYHRIGASRNDHVPTVSAEAFERQVALLVRWSYHVLSLGEVVGCLDRNEPFPRRSVVMTFDDGYEETHRIVWPLLKRFGVPATVFVTPGEVGLPGFATWDQVAEMARDGASIGSHTMHHIYLPLAKEAKLTEEIVQSKQVIESRLGRPVEYLSYPLGGFTPLARAIVQQAGYLCACTTNRARSRWTTDRFALRRIKVTERDRHPLLFRAKVSGHYDLFRQLKQPA